MRPVLVTGGSGQVGIALRRAAWPDGLAPIAPDRHALDLDDADSIAAMVASRSWAAVINAGAYTAVDRAEREVVAAWRTNALAPAALAAACRDAGVPIVQVSTDYIFDGARAGAWEVDDAPRPLGVYGASKLGGELALAAAPRHAIVRTAWVVSAHGTNFVRTMLWLAGERDAVRVVDDQHGAPTGADDLAAALIAVTRRLVDDPDAPSGIWHFSNAGATSWCGFARAIFDGAARRGMRVPAVTPIATADYPTAARRPANSLLATGAITRDFGMAPRPWSAALDDILDELIGAAA